MRQRSSSPAPVTLKPRRLRGSGRLRAGALSFALGAVGVASVAGQACGGSDTTAPAVTPAARFCASVEAQIQKCGSSGECDASLVADCANLAAVLSDPYLAAAADCIDAGGSPFSCLKSSLKSLAPTAAHQSFAGEFCKDCLKVVPDCESVFFDEEGDASAAGKAILPFGDGLVDELRTECTEGFSCAGTFASCAQQALVKRALPEETAKCFFDTLTSGSDAPENPSNCEGAGGAGGQGGASSSSNGTSSTSGSSSSKASVSSANSSNVSSANSSSSSGVTSSSSTASGGGATVVEVCAPDLLLFPLALTKGDKEFDGNGPKAEMDVTVTFNPTGVTFEGCVTMTETKPDTTTGHECDSVFVSRTGILGFDGPTPSFSASYTDNDTSKDDVFKEGSVTNSQNLVKTAVCQGDTGDDDICTTSTTSCSNCLFTFNCVKVRVSN